MKAANYSLRLGIGLTLAIGLFGYSGYLIAGHWGTLTFVLGSLIFFLVYPYLVACRWRYFSHASPLPLQPIPQLNWLIIELSQRANLTAVPRLFYVPSRHFNVITITVFGRPTIFITDALLRLLRWRELGALLAHEIALLKAPNFVFLNGFCGLAVLAKLIALLALFIWLIETPKYSAPLMSFPTLIWFVLLPKLVTQLSAFTTHALVFQADALATHLTHDPKGLIRGLMILQGYQTCPWEATPQRVDGLNASTPVRQRLHRLADLTPTHAPYTAFLETNDLPLFTLEAGVNRADFSDEPLHSSRASD